MTYYDYFDADVLDLDAAETIPSSELTWPGASDDQLRFMRRVYDINLQRSINRGSTFVADVPAGELSTIEGRFLARTAAAADCVRLLNAARQDIRLQGRAVSIGLTSAYRSASEQFRLWQQYFTEPANGYYKRTATQRQSQADGEHGETAAQLTATFIRPKIAVPGFSNHNNGLAIDFLNVENGNTIPNKTTKEATDQWKGTWFWAWMVVNAQTYNFFQNTNINEPWHWEYRATPRRTDSKPVEIADSWESGSQFIEAIDFSETGGGTFRRLQLKDVHYLSFEGGGGKGFVYTGAITALQELGVLRFTNGRLDPKGPIKGISGASAGSMTAMLLSIGYNADAIAKLMKKNDFNRFFDLPSIPSNIPQINGCRNGGTNIVIRALESILSGIVALTIPNIPGVGVRGRVEEFINNRLEGFFRNRIDQSHIYNGPVTKLTSYPLHYLNDIVEDLGIFSGCNVRDFLNKLLFEKAKQQNLTFRQHFEIFQIKLVLTGTNLETGTSEYFSSDTTPNMPVADAVRISMGLPFIFKPYRVTDTEALNYMGNKKLAGLWVDGGVRNNLPIRAFENAPESRPHTLGIRLGEEEVRPITSIVDMFMALSIHQGLMGSGEAEISRTSGYHQQAITLSTKGLSLINFKPSEKILTPLVAEARASVVKYFDSWFSLPVGGDYFDKAGANQLALTERVKRSKSGQQTKKPKLLLDSFIEFKAEVNFTIDAFDNSIENACIQFNNEQFNLFKEELKVKDTDSFFVEVILGSIFIGFAGVAIMKIASKIFTPMIKTRALIVNQGDKVIVSSLTEKELERFKNTTLPKNINFLADDSTDTFAKTLFTSVLDQAGEKLIDRALSSSTQVKFSSKSDAFLTQFKEKIDFWVAQFKSEQNKTIDKIISILNSQQLTEDLEKKFYLELRDLRSQITQVGTVDEMRQIRYYYELCMWSVLYRYILFHGIEETKGQTYNDITLSMAKNGGFQYPNHFNDIRSFNLPSKISKYIYNYWTKQFPHPSSPVLSFDDYYNAFRPKLAQRYNVSINQGGFKRTQDSKYLEPLLEAEKFYDLAHYMLKIAGQFDGATKFTEIISGSPK